jgi:SNF2 family DNA or RNA helicase
MHVLPLRPYQRVGVAWIVSQLQRPDNRAVFLADEPGLGKTRQTLAVLDNFTTNRCLIVCPAGVRHVWRREIEAWFPSWQRRILLIEPGAQPPTDAQLADPLRILIVAYDTLSASRSPILGQLMAAPRWGCLVLDEAHYCKAASNRTKAVYGIAGRGGLQSRCDRAILLSGTPAPNHVGELFRHLQALWPHTITRTPPGGEPRPMNEPEFQERFTHFRDTVYGRQILGSRNVDQLRELLQPILLRRTKAQVLPELPPLILQDVPLG